MKTLYAKLKVVRIALKAASMAATSAKTDSCMNGGSKDAFLTQDAKLKAALTAVMISTLAKHAKKAIGSILRKASAWMPRAKSKDARTVRPTGQPNATNVRQDSSNKMN